MIARISGRWLFSKSFVFEPSEKTKSVSMREMGTGDSGVAGASSGDEASAAFNDQPRTMDTKKNHSPGSSAMGVAKPSVGGDIGVGALVVC